jgi:transcriptional regulator with XRE-family HTH domain
MPKSPRPENRNHPLRKLREILGTNNQPMSQPLLGKKLGVSAETIRAIENGHRSGGVPSQKLLDRISRRLGAFWFAPKKTWVCSLPGGLPYTHDTYRLWKKMNIDRIEEADALANGVISLLLGVSDEQFIILSDQLFRLFHELAHEFKILPDEEFEGMNMQICNLPQTSKEELQFKRQRARWDPTGKRPLLDFHYRASPNQPPRKKPKFKPPEVIFVWSGSSPPNAIPPGIKIVKVPEEKLAACELRQANRRGASSGSSDE